MTNLLSFDATQLLGFVLIMIRVAGIIATAPIFGSENIPLQLRILFVVFIALILHPFINNIQVFPDQVHHYLLLVGSELLIGVVLGMIGRMMLAAVEFAGELAGFQMGLAIANVFDPQSQQQISLIGQFESTLALLIFLVMDAHHIVIQAIVQSYNLLPPGGAGISISLVEEIIRLSAAIFVIGFQLGAPLIVSLFLANLTMGLLARSVPQIQVFVVGFPLTLLTGFIFLMLAMPFFLQAVRMMFEMFDDQIFNVLRLLSG